MGCGQSTLAQYDTDDDEENAELNEEQKKEELLWQELPSVTFIRHDKIEKLFKIQKVLGRGGSCRVLRVKKKETKASFAMKELVRDDTWNPILFRQEIEILTKLQHPGILNYCEAYVQDKYLYVCTKLCTGGELFDKVKRLNHFSEKQAAEVLRSILEAMLFVHKKGIVHRDLKPENIVYANNSATSPIVIIDFGDATPILHDQQVFSDFVGTPFYLAPECVRNRAGWELYKSDMWAIGVIAYVLLTGRPPFFGQNNRQILMKITRAKVTWPRGAKLSRSCKRFILGLLQKDVRKRFSAKRALKHDWIVKEAPLNNEHLGHGVRKNLRKFHNASRLKKLIVTKMVQDMSDEDKQAIAEAFKELDTNGDGFLDHEEIVAYLRATGLTMEKCKKRATQLIEGMDRDGDGKVDLNEWIESKAVENLSSNEQLIEAQFNKIASVSLAQSTSVGSNSSTELIPANRKQKTITVDEIKSSFADILDEAELDDIVNEIDDNGDGTISLQEFQQAMHQYTQRA